MNKKTRAVTEGQYKKIISVIRSGFVCADGHVVKPNERIATALSLEANLGLRISDILQLKLSAIIRDGNRYRLDNNLNPSANLFEIQERAVNKYLKLACDHLKISGIASHSFRKYFATSIYVNNNYNIELVRVLLQHSSVVTTQRYLSIQTREIENALQNHIMLV